MLNSNTTAIQMEVVPMQKEKEKETLLESLSTEELVAELTKRLEANKIPSMNLYPVRTSLSELISTINHRLTMMHCVSSR